MNSSSRVKLLTALLGLLFVGAVGFLVLQGREEEQAAANEKASKEQAKSKLSSGDHPRCPDCGRELPSSGECPFCLMKKKTGGSGAEPPSRFGKLLAWTAIGSTLILGAVHLAMFLRERRRFMRPQEEGQLKTRCPFCKRRVRFAARLADLVGTCPTCKKNFTFKPEYGRYS
jgi:ribosomal protein L37AE/L43A